VGETISFDGAGSSDNDGSIVSYAWDFGDGNTGGGAIATHSYATAGSYQVTLTVTDDDGLTDEATHMIQIEEPPPVDQPPTAAISGPDNGLVGDMLAFDGSGSSDDSLIVSYAWDFGDGNTSGGAIANHSYATAGSYQVNLTVTDDGGLTGETTHTIQIDEPPPVNQPPTAAISGPDNGLVGESLTFDGSGSSDTDGDLVSYAWDFGDGNTSGGAIANHGYATAGSYQVNLTVTDNDQLTGGATHIVLIEEPTPAPQPPTAVIIGPANGLVGESLSFDASDSSDGDGNVVGYAWDFGDGARADGLFVSHVYDQPGDYQVTLTVTDNDQLTGEATHIVQIEAPAPQPPTAVINGG
jgi:PKD repeat protein